MTLRLLGLRVRVSATWVLVLALIVFSLAAIGGSEAEPSSDALRWAMGLGVAVFFFLSVLFHEIVHTLVARRLGVEVREIVLLVVGGTAHLGRETDDPRRELLIALAGPLASLALGGLLLGVFLGAGEPPGTAGLLLSNLVWWVALSNLLLGGLNLLPAFPLDGLRMLRAILWRLSGDFVRATRQATWVARILAYGLIGLGLALALSDELIMGIWLAVIGWLLGQAAEGAYRRVEFGLVVEGMLVRDVMERDPPVVGPNLTLDTLVEQHLLGGRSSVYPVTLEGELVGTVEMAHVKGVPRAEWPNKRVTDVMLRGDRLSTLTELLSLLDALRRLDESGAAGLPVVADDDRRLLLGMVTREGLSRAIRQRAALQARSAR
ncbi:MAG TPA: site-2 protease family protein [Candidatus Limnocylindria bacterium]|nr:site-2 protease family protein [Candidatus Limnocylindria bacterium]